MLKSSGILRFQDVFEIKYSRTPDEPAAPAVKSEPPTPIKEDEEDIDSSSPVPVGSDSDPEVEADSEAEREKRLKELQDQVGDWCNHVQQVL